VAPGYTAVEVKGQLDLFLPNSSLPSGLNNQFLAGGGSGNALVTAAAIDYDMWRNYGFRHGQPIKAPFLSNPQTQCAPYASMILSRNRKEVLKGSCTIAGNEYSQPGEVVFLEDRQMLFYVTEVRHSFTYNSKFTTTLTLEYGHTPGDYIPTPTDIIGKLLNNNKDAGNLIVYRQGSSFPEESLGVLQLGPANAVKTDEEEDTSTDYSSDSDPNALTKENNRVINDIIYKSRQIIAKNQGTTGNVKGKIELRIFYNTKTNVKVNMALQKFAEEKKYILSGFNSAISSQNGKEPQSPINPNHIDIVHIDTSDRNERRSVSSAALNAARNNIEKTSYGNTDASNLGNQFNYVYNYIVDCFLVVEQTTDQGSNGA
jgi:hypothetical protein